MEFHYLKEIENIYYTLLNMPFLLFFRCILALSIYKFEYLGHWRHQGEQLGQISLLILSGNYPHSKTAPPPPNQKATAPLFLNLFK